MEGTSSLVGPHPEAAHPDFTPNVHLGYPASSTLSVQETSLQEEARQGSSESPPLVSPRIRRFERARKRCRRAAALLAQQESESERKSVEMAKMCADVEFDHTYACSSSLDAELTTDHSHQDHSRRHQAQPSQQLSTSKSRDNAAMSAEVEVGMELSFSTDMNETVLERLAHLEGKLKEMEEENKSLSVRIADFESPTLEASRDFGVHLIEGNDKKNAVLHRSAGFWCFSGSHQVSQEKGNSTSPMEGGDGNRRGVFIAWPEALEDISSGRTVLCGSCQAALGLEGRRCVRPHRTCTVYILKDVRYLGGFFGVGAASFVSMAK